MADSGRVERTERLLDLLLCLMATSRPVPRSAIKSVVPGYDEAPSDMAFERMFERDKDELRSMGIPVETVTDAGGDIEGYRLAQDYGLGEVSFTPAEFAVISLAASVWDEAAMGAPATNALRKLESVQPDGPPLLPEPTGVRLHARDASMLPLLAGLREGRAVTFGYRSAQSDAPERRRVDPWGVVARDGRWYLVGFDHARQAPRVFRLSRIEGTVTVTAQQQLVPMPAGTDVAAMVGQMAPELQAEATVHVRAGSGAALRRQDSGDPFADATFAVRAPTEAQLIGMVCAAGDAAVVREPQQVRERVIATLTLIRDQHSVDVP